MRCRPGAGSAIGRSFQAGPRSHHKPVALAIRYDIQLVKAFRRRGTLQTLDRAHHTRHRDLALAQALRIAPQRIMQLRIEEIAADSKARPLRGIDVNRALGRAHIGVVDNERLAGAEAGCQESALAWPSLDQIQADANVGIEEALAIE